MEILKQFIGLILVIALGIGLYNLAIKTRNGPKDFAVSADSTATFTGTVLENNTNCFDSNSSDGCFLLVQSGQTKVPVMYNTSDNGFCINEAATNTGRNTRVGSTVKIYGFYKQDNKTNAILTCPNTNYYIKPF